MMPDEENRQFTDEEIGNLISELKQSATVPRDQAANDLLKTMEAMRQTFAKNITTSEDYDAFLKEVENARDKIWQEKLKAKQKNDA